MDKSSLIRRNIEACELARKWKCTCPCQGLYHRKKHPKEWIEQIIAESTEEEAQNELDLG
jgi:hypothetical protein